MARLYAAAPYRSGNAERTICNKTRRGNPENARPSRCLDAQVEPQKPAGSVNFGLRHHGLALQEIEIAALVGLADVLGEHRAIAARVFGGRRRPGGLPAGEFGVADMQMDHPLVDVDLDLVAGLHESQRTADEALRRHVENARAVA